MHDIHYFIVSYVHTLRKLLLLTLWLELLRTKMLIWVLMKLNCDGIYCSRAWNLLIIRIRYLFLMEIILSRSLLLMTFMSLCQLVMVIMVWWKKHGRCGNSFFHIWYLLAYLLKLENKFHIQKCAFHVFRRSCYDILLQISSKTYPKNVAFFLIFRDVSCCF